MCVCYPGHIFHLKLACRLQGVDNLAKGCLMLFPLRWQRARNACVCLGVWVEKEERVRFTHSAWISHKEVHQRGKFEGWPLMSFLINHCHTNIKETIARPTTTALPCTHARAQFHIWQRKSYNSTNYWTTAAIKAIEQFPCEHFFSQYRTTLTLPAFNLQFRNTVCKYACEWWMMHARMPRKQCGLNMDGKRPRQTFVSLKIILHRILRT